MIWFVVTESFFQRSFIAPCSTKLGYLLIFSSLKTTIIWLFDVSVDFLSLLPCRFDIPEGRKEKSYRYKHEWKCGRKSMVVQNKGGGTIENELYRSFRIIGCEHLVCVVFSSHRTHSGLKTYVVRATWGRVRRQALIYRRKQMFQPKTSMWYWRNPMFVHMLSKINRRKPTLRKVAKVLPDKRFRFSICVRHKLIYIFRCMHWSVEPRCVWSNTICIEFKVNAMFAQRQADRIHA